jgi:hypothetical protein
MSEDFTNRMLANIGEELKRAQRAPDPVTRLGIIAQLQTYAGWALRWAIADARAAGQSWPSLGHILGQEPSTIYRQYNGGGPVVVVRPRHAAGTRNDGQNSVRQAAARLAQQFAPLTAELAASAASGLCDPVGVMATAMLTPAAEPLLAAIDAVLDTADLIYPERASGPQETAIWEAVAALRNAVTRDRATIEAAALAARELPTE